jgi:chromosome segregation ATPase
MEITKEAVEQFLELLRDDPELRERARQIIVAADWERVDRAIERMAAEIAAFSAETRARIAEVERTTGTRFNEVTLQFEKVEGKIEELRQDMGQGFEQVDQRFVELRQDMGQRFEQVDQRFVELRQDMDQRFEQVDRRFAELRQDMDQGFIELRQEMDQRFEQVDRRFEQVDQRFEQVDRRFEQVDQRFERVELRLDRVEIRLDHVEVRLDRVEKRLGRVEGELGNLVGSKFEERLRVAAGRYLGPWFRKVRQVDPAATAEVEEALERGVLSDEEFRDLLRADAFVRAAARRGDPGEQVLVIEASKVIDRVDVERAVRRAVLLQRIWTESRPAVYGEAITRGANELANAAGVAVLVERVVETAEEDIGAA